MAGLNGSPNKAMVDSGPSSPADWSRPFMESKLIRVDVCPPPPKKHKQEELARMPVQITAAALVSGFSLGRLKRIEVGTNGELKDAEDPIVYLLLIVAVHMCTCSLLSSILLYRRIVGTTDTDLALMEGQLFWKFMFRLPLISFAVGGLAYVCSVVVISFRDSNVDKARWVQISSVVIGVCSIFMLLFTIMTVELRIGPKLPKQKNDPAPPTTPLSNAVEQAKPQV